MADVALNKGFVCPKCRLIVAAPMLVSGYAAQCPGCNASLKIPSKTNIIQSISVQSKSLYATASPSANRRTYHQNRNDSWQDELPKELLAERARGLPWHMLAPAGVLGLTLFIGLLYLLKSTVTPPASKPIPVVVAETAVDVLEFEGSPMVASVTREQVLDYLKKLNSLTTSEELAKLVRQVPKVADRIKGYYPNNGAKLIELGENFVFERVLGRDNVYLLNVELRSGAGKAAVVFQDANGGLGLDWDSYVGYCEIPWDELKVQQPKAETLVRAVRRKSEYYNLGFSSDEWQSFELRYPNSDEILIGYAKRNSALIHQLLPIGSNYAAMDVTLKIHYPETVQDDRFVIIDSVVASDWIAPSDK